MPNKKKGFNDYKVFGDITEFYIINWKGEKFTVLIDTEDLPKLIDRNYRWHVRWDNCIQDYYISTTPTKEDKKNFSILNLHNLIMNTNNIVDHIYRDPMDNRKTQLRVTSDSNNKRNRKGRNSNNTSGYRNVTADKRKKEWIVQLWVDGKNLVWRGFKSPEEANEHAINMRQLYYGEFAGKG